jgi:hypothetical protein
MHAIKKESEFTIKFNKSIIIFYNIFYIIKIKVKKASLKAIKYYNTLRAELFIKICK